MIVSFGDATTADIYHGSDTKAARKLPREIWTRVQRKLDLLNACTPSRICGLLPPIGWRSSKGDLAGFYSMRVNEQYRLVFRFAAGHCQDVRCTDYH